MLLERSNTFSNKFHVLTYSITVDNYNLKPTKRKQFNLNQVAKTT